MRTHKQEVCFPGGMVEEVSGFVAPSVCATLSTEVAIVTLGGLRTERVASSVIARWHAVQPISNHSVPNLMEMK